LKLKNRAPEAVYCHTTGLAVNPQKCLLLSGGCNYMLTRGPTLVDSRFVGLGHGFTFFSTNLWRQTRTSIMGVIIVIAVLFAMCRYLFQTQLLPRLCVWWSVMDLRVLICGFWTGLLHAHMYLCF